MLALPLQQAFTEITHGIPYGKESRQQHGDEDEQHILPVHAHRIGVYHKAVGRSSQRKETETLLDEAEQQSQHNADYRSDEGNHTPLEQEDAYYQLVAGSQIAQGLHILLLVDDEHRQGTDDIEAGYH